MDKAVDFDSLLNQAWDQHAGEPAAVADRLAREAPALADSSERVVALAHLAHHVYGAHLGRWANGRALLERLAALPAADASAAAALARFIASLDLCGGRDDPRTGMAASDRIRVTALAAASLAEHDAARAGGWLAEATADAEAAALSAADPAVRELAVAGNNIAAALEEKAPRTAAERELMIAAAQAGRRWWALAGTWLETERAEYRLAMSWLQAGDAERARRHAQQCLDIVQAHGSVALESFFGHEALARAERAAGDDAAAAQAVAAARSAFDVLDEGDRGWCRATLDKLNASAAP